MAAVWELPLFVVALTRLGIVKTDALRRNRRLGYFLVVCLAVALPGVDPVTVFFETLPLLDPVRDARSGSPSCSTAAARRMHRPAAPPSRRDRGLRRLGAPGPRPAPERRSRHLGGRRIVEVAEGRAERHFDGAMILPGLVNAHSHLEYAVYAGFGDGEVFGDWLGTHISRKRALDHDDMVAIARRGAADSLAAG